MTGLNIFKINLEILGAVYTLRKKFGNLLPSYSITKLFLIIIRLNSRDTNFTHKFNKFKIELRIRNIKISR